MIPALIDLKRAVIESLDATAVFCGEGGKLEFFGAAAMEAVEGGEVDL